MAHPLSRSGSPRPGSVRPNARLGTAVAGEAPSTSRSQWLSRAAFVVALAGCGSVDLAPADAESGEVAATGDTSGPPEFEDTPGPGADLGFPDGGGEDLADARPSDDLADAGPSDDLADAGPSDDLPEDVAGVDAPGGEDVVSPPSRCAVDAAEGTITCDFEVATIEVTAGVLTESREVLWQVPLTAPPPGGYPVAILFHGTQVPAELQWEGDDGALGELGGLWYQVSVVKELLDAGFAVLTPRSQVIGYWNTNAVPWSALWDTAPDHALMVELIARIASGTFGDLDVDRLYPGGISSGGYMASRVALTYGGVKAAAVHSASYMTCAAAFCVVPELPDTHPPTLFLHGQLDAVVPVLTMELYRDALNDLGVATETVVDPEVGHAWIPASPEAIRDWFLAHP